MIPITRRALSVGALVCGLTAGISAQQKSPEELFAEKQKEAWLVDGGWTLDFDAAKKQAAESGKSIFAYFSRSYAF